MNAFTKEQNQAIARLFSLFHPDKNPGSIAATGFTQALNKAKEFGMFSTVQTISALVAKFGITKENKSGLDQAWEEFQKIPGTGPSQDEERQKRRANERKEREEKAEQERAQREKEREEREAKEKADFEELIKSLKETAAANGWGRSKMASYLDLNFDIKGKKAKELLDIIFAGETGEKRSRGAFADFLNQLREGPMSDADWEEWLKNTTENNRNHSSQFKGIKDCVNAVWAKKASQ